MGAFGAVLLIVGVCVFIYGFANTNIEAPSSSDPGNAFIWPGIIIAAIGILLLIVRACLIFLSVFYQTH